MRRLEDLSLSTLRGWIKEKRRHNTRHIKTLGELQTWISDEFDVGFHPIHGNITSRLYNLIIMSLGGKSWYSTPVGLRHPRVITDEEILSLDPSAILKQYNAGKRVAHELEVLQTKLKEE